MFTMSSVASYISIKGRGAMKSTWSSTWFKPTFTSPSLPLHITSPSRQLHLTLDGEHFCGLDVCVKTTSTESHMTPQSLWVQMGAFTGTSVTK